MSSLKEGILRKNLFICIGIALLFLIVILIFSLNRKNQDIKPKIKQSLVEIDFLLKEGNLLQARSQLEDVFRDSEDLVILNRLKGTIEDLNIKILFSPTMDEYSALYIVQPNDALIKIARKFSTTVALIKKANGLTTDMIRPGQKLKVHNCDFSIVVDKSQNILFLKRNHKVIKTYLVSTGKNNTTPVGRFKIVNKLKHPTWFKTGAVVAPDSPDNELGTRWMGINEKGYGIHGTNSIDQIGMQVTQGCVRMKNSEIDELFNIVPLGTEVVIID